MDELLQILSFIAETKNARPTSSRDQFVALVRDRFRLAQEGTSLLISQAFALKLVRVPADSDHAASGYAVLSMKRLKQLDDRPVVACAIGPEKVRFALVNSTFVHAVSTGAKDLTESHVQGSFFFRDVRSQHESIPNDHPTHFPALFAKHRERTWEDNLKRIARNSHSVLAWRRVFTPKEEQLDYIVSAPERLLDFLESGTLAKLQAEYDAVVEASQEAFHEAYNLAPITRTRRARELLGWHQLVGTERTKVVDSFFWEDGFYLGLDMKTREIEGTKAKGVSAPIYYFDKMFEFLARSNSVHLLVFIHRPKGGGLVRCKIVPTLVDQLRRSIRLTLSPQFLHGFAVVTHQDWVRVFDDDYVPQVNVLEAKDFLLAALDRKQPNPRARKKRRKRGDIKVTRSQREIMLRAGDEGGKILFAVSGGFRTMNSLIRKKLVEETEDEEGPNGLCYQLSALGWEWYRKEKAVDSRSAAE